MISLDQARKLAQDYRVIPLVRTLFSGSETPLSVFEKLTADSNGGFLLESAEQGVWSRYSFIGVSNLGVLYKDSQGVWFNDTEDIPTSRLIKTLLSDKEGLEALSIIQSHFTTAPTKDLPPLVSGMVGFLSWNTVNEIENLPPAKTSRYDIPDMAMAILRDLVVIDHSESTIKIISNLYINDVEDLELEYSRSVSRIDHLQESLLIGQKPFISNFDRDAELEFERITSHTQFIEMVDEAKRRVEMGDVFQVVLSQQFVIDVSASALDVYRALRALNPSPYMYILNFEDSRGAFSVVGSSPEALVKVSHGSAVLHPIAGSRPRGVTVEEDLANSESLLEDNKERAEHLMLVDLARNDLLKVCVPDSVSVTDFMSVERYSHIMHLVSTVEGTTAKGVTAVDVVRATFPAGTLSGAPKPMALSVINELEPFNRGLFGGVVGYLDFSGNADLAIAIRTVVIRDGKGYVQAGAGIVLDSVPDSEDKETISKASAPLRAVLIANSMSRLT